MRIVGGSGHAGRLTRGIVLAAGCAALAGCNTGMSKVDPKYGVSASARVVEMGDPVPKGGGKYRVGNPYVVAGKTYVPEENSNYRAEGLASWYGNEFHGRFTANGEIFDMESISAAHPTLPLPSYVRVTNLHNKRSMVVRVNDRGPYAHDRIIDLSRNAAKALGFHDRGLAKVRVEYVGKAPLAGSDDRKLMATLRDGGQTPAGMPVEPKIQVASADGGFAPASSTYFDSRPMMKQVPMPSDRPYALGQPSSEPRAVASAQTTELAANARPQAVTSKPLPEASEESAPRLTSPVSAYAAPKYDGRAGFMNGRGLY